MNRKILLSFMVTLLMMGNVLTVNAEEHATVTFEQDNDLVYSGLKTGSDGDEKLSTAFEGIAPGETATQKITIHNNNDKPADFYMHASALKALEDAGKGKGAGYEIKLTTGGKDLYNSNAGGYANNSSTGSKDGIKAMNDGALEDYVLIATLEKGESQDIDLSIFFDGEAMDNGNQGIDYSKSLGQLGFSFQVAYEEPGDPKVIYKTVTEKGKKKVIRKFIEIFENGVPLSPVATGDTALIGAGFGVLLLGIFLVILANKKSKTEEEV